MDTYDRALVLLDCILEDFTGGPGIAHDLGPLIPRRVEIDSNSFREADEARIELDYDDLPLDPRCIRSIKVSVFVGDAGPGDADLDTSRENLRFIGFVDAPTSSLDESDERLRLECRDYTSPLIDADFIEASVNIDQPLRDVLVGLISSVKGMEGLAEAKTLIIEPSAAGVKPSSLTGRKRWTPPNRASVWDAIVGVCEFFGLVPVVRLDKLYVRKAVDVAQLSAALTYGVNVARLERKRQIQGKRSRQIRVVAWDEQARKQREAKFPAKAPTLRLKHSVKGKFKEEKAKVASYYLSGSYTEAQLRDIAERIYEDGQRREIEGTIETFDIAAPASFTPKTSPWSDAPGATPVPMVDLLALSNGDAVDVRLERTLGRSIQGLTVGEATARLVEAGMDPTTAGAVAEAWSQVENVAITHYVDSVRITWDPDSGCALTIKYAGVL